MNVDWQEANQRYLVASLGRVRAALRDHVGDHSADDVDRRLAQATAELPGPAAIDALSGSFGLSAFEPVVTGE